MPNDLPHSPPRIRTWTNGSKGPDALSEDLALGSSNPGGALQLGRPDPQGATPARHERTREQTRAATLDTLHVREHRDRRGVTIEAPCGCRKVYRGTGSSRHLRRVFCEDHGRVV